MFMEGTGDTFLYVLAEKLHMTVADVRRMSSAELAGWRAYTFVRQTLDDLAARTAEHRR